MLPLWLTCVVLSGYFSLQGDYGFESLQHPQSTGEACSLCSNVEHEMI
jgi:hypothetical protein